MDISTRLSGSDTPSNPDAEEPIILNSTDRELYSPYAILVRLRDQQVGFESRSEERISPASLTKIMTAIVAIENIADLHEPVILENKIFKDLYAANASLAGFLPGEEVPAIDLLYGTLLPSGADASVGLALKVSGSESEFVKLMNRKAEQLGMKDTHFTNVCGLYDDNHYSTVKDIAVLLEYALHNETFRQVFTSMRHSTASTNRHPGGITLYSTLFVKTETYEFDGGRILGGKTGYTAESGQCLASLAEKNGTEYILVTAGAAGDHKTQPYHIMDAFTVYGNYLKQ
ncbi:MAG: D-alanyl-D-alanine carboxypeptidase family protein [Syntrophomonadales bacterium]